MKTLIIRKEHIAKVLTPAIANDAVEKAFKAHGSGQVQMPAKSYLYFRNGDLRAMPAYIHGQGFNIAGIKGVNVHPLNRKYKLPTIMAVVILVDPETGFPLAVLDGTYLTAMRTGAAGALASKLLSRKDSKIAGFVGCGSQARTQLSCTMAVRKLEVIKVWARTPKSQSASRFCQWAKRRYKVTAAVFPNIDEVTTGTDILFTTTPSRRVLVKRISPGSHVNAMGADAKGKREIGSRILKRAKVVIDDWDQASHSGEINVPLRRKQLSRRKVYAELGQIVVGKKKGRTSAEEITLFDSTGLAIQDISCAYAVYAAVKNRAEVEKISLF